MATLLRINNGIPSLCKDKAATSNSIRELGEQIVILTFDKHEMTRISILEEIVTRLMTRSTHATKVVLLLGKVAP